MHLKATLTIDMPSLTAIIKSHVEQAGYVLEDLMIEFDHTAADPVDIRCEVRPMSKEEAEAAGVEVKSPEDHIRDVLDDYLEQAVDALKDHVSKTTSLAVAAIQKTVAQSGVRSEPSYADVTDSVAVLPLVAARNTDMDADEVREDRVPTTYLGASAALSAEAAAKRKQNLRRRMKAEAAVLMDPIEAIEEYEND